MIEDALLNFLGFGYVATAASVKMVLGSYRTPESSD